MNHCEVLLEPFDGRFEALVIFRIRQQAAGRVVRGEHDAGAEFQRDIEEAADQKRIGNIVDMEFVEAQQRDAVEPLPRYRAEPVVAARFVDESPVHLAQELVEMDAPLRALGQFEDGIDHEALAASWQTVAIDTLCRSRGAGRFALRRCAEQIQ